MDDQEFLDRIKAKIERLTGTEIRLHLDVASENQIKLDLERPIPEVTLGSNILQHSGFARMAIEYAVASIRQKRELGLLEFQVLMARN